MTTRRRVVVTGIGVESCIGRDVESFWSAVAGGRPGLGAIRSFDAGATPWQVAGEVDLDPHETLSASEVRRTSRFQHLVASAAAKAVADAGSPDLRSAAVVIGTGGGGLGSAISTLRELPPDGRVVDPFAIMKALPYAGAALVARMLHARGPCLTIGTACAAATDAIGLGASLVRQGVVDRAVVGGAEAWIMAPVLSAFGRLRVLSTAAPADAATASRPFDVERDGMVPAEGAAVLVIEAADLNRESGRWRVEIAGSASTCDAAHPTAPAGDANAAAAVITMALADAGIGADAVRHVNAHGTGTALNDPVEARAIARALGEHARGPLVSSTKAIHGHSLGGSGAIETAATVLAIENRLAPPNINLDAVDPDCDLVSFVGREAEPADIEVALKVSFGFGGHNSALVLRRIDG